MRLAIWTLTLSLASVAPSAQAAPKTEVKALVERMQGFYEKTKDFRAEFDQVYRYKAFNRTQSSSGWVLFKKPALMRWEYEQPSKKTFVLNGEKVYVLDPEAMTLTTGINLRSNQLSASVTFLWGRGKLGDEFKIEKTPCAVCTGTLLTLTPKVLDLRFQRVLLEVDPKTAQVLKSTVVDPDGSENVISFKNMKTNVGAEEAAFHLTPPEGTQVIDMSQIQKP